MQARTLPDWAGCVFREALEIPEGVKQDDDHQRNAHKPSDDAFHATSPLVALLRWGLREGWQTDGRVFASGGAVRQGHALALLARKSPCLCQKKTRVTCAVGIFDRPATAHRQRGKIGQGAVAASGFLRFGRFACRQINRIDGGPRGTDVHLQNRTFDDLSVGQTAELVRLVTPDDLYVFAASSGNYNPMHMPDGDLDGDGRPERVAPGMFVASLISGVLGTQMPGPGTLYRSQSLRFHIRAHAGDELRCRVTVLAKLDGGVVRLATEVRRMGDEALIVEGEAEVQAPTVRFDRDDIEVPGLIVQRHRHFAALLDRARPLPALPTAVVCPDEANALGGALLAMRESLITPVLLGKAGAIRAAAAEMGADLAGIEIVDVAGPDTEVAAVACRLVQEGRVAAVMKGHLHTEDLLRPMLDKAGGLRVGRRFTHIFVMDVPGQPEPIMVTDAAINIAPDLMTKVDICQNAIDLALSLGMEPRVGVLSAVETVNPDIQSSIDAALLSKMADRGQIRGGQVEGPLAMDNAVDIGAARTKGLKGNVAGRANILVVPGIDAGNMLAKQLAFISHAEGAGLVMGAKVPVILNSRSDSAMSRLASCAVAAIHHFAGKVV